MYSKITWSSQILKTLEKKVCDSFDTVVEFSVVPGVWSARLLKLHRHTKSVAHLQTHNWFTHRKHLFETRVVWTQMQHTRQSSIKKKKIQKNNFISGGRHKGQSEWEKCPNKSLLQIAKTYFRKKIKKYIFFFPKKSESLRLAHPRQRLQAGGWTRNRNRQGRQQLSWSGLACWSVARGRGTIWQEGGEGVGAGRLDTLARWTGVRSCC